MSKSEKFENSVKTLFHYAQLIADVQRKSGKSLEKLSEELNCTAAHMSNVKRGKSTFSMDKVLKLLNEYNYCIDDYMEEGQELSGDVNDIMDGIPEENGDLELLLVEFIANLVSLSRRSPKEKRYDFTSEERKQKIAVRIREERRRQNIPTDAMCKRAQIQKMTYQNIENGSNGTTPENYRGIAKALKVPASFFMRDVVKNKKGLIRFHKKRAAEGMNFREKKIIGAMAMEIWEVVVKYMKML